MHNTELLEKVIQELRSSPERLDMQIYYSVSKQKGCLAGLICSFAGVDMSTSSKGTVLYKEQRRSIFELARELAGLTCDPTN